MAARTDYQRYAQSQLRDTRRAVSSVARCATIEALAFAADIDHIHIDRSFLPIALDLQCHAFADPRALELVGQVRQTVDRLAVHADDHIRELSALGIGATQPGALARRSRHGPHPRDAPRSRARRRRLACGDDPDTGSGHVSLADNLGHDAI